MKRCFPLLFGLLVLLPASLLGAEWKAEQMNDAVVIRDVQGAEVVRYQLQPLQGSKLAVDSACYFHPARTPSGLALTEVAPPDHLHHRGIFLAWVEMHGKKDADFWGWGEHALKTNRVIVNLSVKLGDHGKDRAGFEARNDWIAEGDVMIHEKLEATARQQHPANILDLTYTLTPVSDVTLSRWAFSGFCMRTRKDGKLEAFGPDGRQLR